jgi:hypothetical protein
MVWSQSVRPSYNASSDKRQPKMRARLGLLTIRSEHE